MPAEPDSSPSHTQTKYLVEPSHPPAIDRPRRHRLTGLLIPPAVKVFLVLGNGPPPKYGHVAAALGVKVIENVKLPKRAVSVEWRTVLLLAPSPTRPRFRPRERIAPMAGLLYLQHTRRTVLAMLLRRGIPADRSAWVFRGVVTADSGRT